MLGKRLAKLSEKQPERSVRIKRGTVQSTTGGECAVLIDGDMELSVVPLACDASVGGRVIILCDGTVWAVIAQYK